jgi:hypothetical protein
VNGVHNHLLEERFILVLRDRTGEPHLLAHELLWAMNGRLLIDAQKQSELPSAYWLYAPTDGQLKQCSGAQLAQSPQ